MPRPLRTIALVALLIAPLISSGQQKAQVAGVVRDPSDAIVPGASVSVVNLDTGVRRMTYSNSEGFYAVSALAAGNYKITVRKDGFRTVAQLGVVLQALETARFDFALPIGSINETVTVEGTAPLINIEDLTTTLVINAGRARDLPLNGRGVQGLVDLAPGVLSTPATAGEAGQFSTNGQRPNTNYFTVDGVSANNGVIGSGLPGQFSGGALPAMTAIGSLHNLASAGELEEVRVQTSTFAPEYGRLPGAQVAVTTRAGSNTVHGDVSYFWRDRSMAANDWFANRAATGETPLRLNHGNGTISGPLRRNSTWGVFSLERLRLAHGRSLITAVPSLAARGTAMNLNRAVARAFPTPNGPDLGGFASEFAGTLLSRGGLQTVSARLDQSLNGRGTAFARYSDARSDSETGLHQRNLTRFRSRSLTLGTVTVIGTAATNDARINVSEISATSEWRPGSLPGREPLDLRTILPFPGNGQQLYALYVQGLGHLVQGDPGKSRQRQVNFVDTLGFVTGRHNIRLGVDYQRLSPARDVAIASVIGTFASVHSLASGGPMSIEMGRTGSGSSLLETLSLFAQDTWHVTPRLNITYGLRWELTPPPKYQARLANDVNPGSTEGLMPWIDIVGSPPQLTPTWSSSLRQLAPRLGIAYRLNSQGTTVLRAGTGYFYDLGFSSATDLINGTPYNRWLPLIAIDATRNDGVQQAFSGDLKVPRSTHWSVTVERALSSEMAISVGYVGSNGTNLLRREGYMDPVVAGKQLVLATSNGRSNYHSAQVQFRSRVRRGVRGVVSYTYGHAIDNGSWDSASFLVFSNRPDADRGSSNFDVRHSGSAALSWNVPSRNRWFGNWMVSGILKARTGFPIDIISSENAFGLGYDNSFRPDLVPGEPVWVADPSAPGGRVLNRRAFRATNAQGNLGRNAIRGIGLFQTDISLQRSLALSERWRAEVRLEAYNILNRASFADPVRYLSSGLFGRSVSHADMMLGTGRAQSGLAPMFQPGGPRSLQLGVALRF